MIPVHDCYKGDILLSKGCSPACTAQRILGEPCPTPSVLSLPSHECGRMLKLGDKSMQDESGAPVLASDAVAVDSDSGGLYGSIYQTLGARRLGYDSMMWQVPALSFTAQAFLLTIALGGGIGVSRLTSAALALIIALISMQLMAKHRFNEEIDSRLLEAFERRLDIEGIFGCPPHAPPGKRMRTVNTGAGIFQGMSPVRRPWYVAISSYNLWQRGLGLFACTSVAIIVVNVVYLAHWDALVVQFVHGIIGAMP